MIKVEFIYKDNSEIMSAASIDIKTINKAFRIELLDTNNKGHYADSREKNLKKVIVDGKVEFEKKSKQKNTKGKK